MHYANTANSNHAHRAHSEIGASSMYRWKACPGSVRRCRGIASKSSSYADEGTKAHEYAEKLLRNEIDTVPEEFESVWTYVNYVRKQAKHGALSIEERVEAAEGAFGTADAVIRLRRTIEVVDYKHGSGIPVEVEKNSQLMYYALGAYHQTLDWDHKEFRITIVQPNCFHEKGPIRSYGFDIDELEAFQLELYKAIQATKAPDAPLVPGEHCRFCPAAPECEALYDKALTVAKDAFDDVSSLTPKKLSEALQLAETLKAFIHNVHEYAYEQAIKGVEIPGYKIVLKVPRRKWTDEKELIEALEFLGIDESVYMERKIKTPAQVEKTLRKFIDPSILDSFLIKESSGYALVEESNKRPSIKEDLIAQFDEIEPEKKEK